jgi:hypothetical protein
LTIGLPPLPSVSGLSSSGSGLCGERNERFQPFTDDIRVRQPGVVRKNFPRRIEKGLISECCALRSGGTAGREHRLETGGARRFTAGLGLQCEPRLNVLLKALLRLKPFRDQHDGALRKQVV